MLSGIWLHLDERGIEHAVEHHASIPGVAVFPCKFVGRHPISDCTLWGGDPHAVDHPAKQP